MDFVLDPGSLGAGRGVTIAPAQIAGPLMRAFGGVSGRATQIAIASDTDNTGSTARAGFADLHFVARGQPCAF